MSKRSKSSRSKSRRITPWDKIPNPTPVQRFIKMHHQTRSEERHQSLDETGEAEMINSFEPLYCPYCGSSEFIRMALMRTESEDTDAAAVNVSSPLP